MTLKPADVEALRLTKEQIEQYRWTLAAAGWDISILCDLALAALATKAGEGEDDQDHADAVLHAHTEICDLFARNSGDYDPTPKEVDAAHDGLTEILGQLATTLRASPASLPNPPDEGFYEKLWKDLYWREPTAEELAQPPVAPKEEGS